MNTINFLLEGFGFKNWSDFKGSAFGFILSEKVLSMAAVSGFIASMIKELLGFSHLFLIAFVLLNVFELVTGIRASYLRNEPHESRKLGRMLLKITTYTIFIFILNTFQKEVNFPVVFGYEVDPFVFLYWVVLLTIIWQLVISTLENLANLNYKFAKMAIRIINKRFYTNFDLTEETDIDE